MRDYSGLKIGPLTMDEVHSKDLLVEMEANFWVLDTDHSVVKLLQRRIVGMAIKGGVNDDTHESGTWDYLIIGSLGGSGHRNSQLGRE